MQIATNVASLNAVRQLTASNGQLGTAFQRLSSGLRINSAKDDAAGLQISNRLGTQISGISQNIRNANDGISMLQTAEGAMQAVTDNLQRLRELSLAAANGANGESERQAIQQEVSQLVSEINRINQTTRFGGRTLFAEGATASVSFAKRAVMVGLKGAWLEESEARIRSYYGIQADGASITVNLETSDGAGGVAASVSGVVGGGGRTDNMMLNIDMADFTPPNLPDGGNSPFYNDRIIMHEMAHAVMGRSMNFNALPGWFKEGTAEFIHGADERVAADIANNGGGAAGRNAIVAAFGTIATSEGYSASYAATRYLHDQIKGQGGSGIKAVLVALAGGATLDAAINTATNGLYASEAAFNAAFTANGANFIAGFNFSNTDTGAIGGLDVDAGEVLTAESIMPDVGIGDGYDDDPLAGFAEIYPDTALHIGSASIDFQVGTQANETIAVGIGSVSATALGVASLDVVNGAQFAVVFIDEAMALVDSQRASLGATMNRLSSTISNLGNMRENIAASRSRVADADYAQETAVLSKAQILQTAGLSVLSQANVSSSSVLQLLRAG